MKPFITVILPLYNRKESLKRAVRSILNQSYDADFVSSLSSQQNPPCLSSPSLELIIVNDGSTDGVEEDLENLRVQDSRVRVIHHPQNKGAAAARNTGILAAQGDVIAFLDSDDEWHREKLEIQGAAMVQTGAFLSCTGFEWHLLDDHLTFTKIPQVPGTLFQSLVYGCDFSPGSTLMVQKSVFQEVGLFGTSFSRLEDWDWMLRYAHGGGEILMVPYPLAKIYTTRDHQGLQILESFYHFIDKNYALLGKQGKCLQRKALASVWLQVAGILKRHHRFWKMLPPLGRAHFYDPFILIRYFRRKI